MQQSVFPQLKRRIRGLFSQIQKGVRGTSAGRQDHSDFHSAAMEMQHADLFGPAVSGELKCQVFVSQPDTL